MKKEIISLRNSIPVFIRSRSKRKISKLPIKKDLTLETGQSARFNIVLEAGSISEQVIVSSEPAVVNTETSAKGEVITQKQVADLPLNGRDFTSLGTACAGRLSASCR